jgi:cardiolipin synthase
MIVLAVIGGLSVAGAIVTLFFALGRRPSKLDVTRAAPVDSPDFLASMAGAMNAPLRTGGTVHLQNNGDAFFPSLLEEIRNAKTSINFLVFIWEPGQVSDQVFPALADAAKRGVEVRLLLDGFGGLKAPEEGVKALEAAGGKVARFRPPRFGMLTRFHKRTHRRSIVMDGKVAFTGGMAVGDKWLGNADSEEHWRDSMVRVTGPLAATVQSAFTGCWAHAAGEILVGEKFYPTLPVPADPVAEPVLMHMGVASAPSSESHPLRVVFIQTFLSAQKSLYITTPYFVPDQVVREAVAKRARSGVDVRILLPDEHTDAKPIRHTTHSYLQDLLEAGVRVYEYQPTMMHTKHVVVDGRWSVVGSANMDIRSKELNEENVLGILDAGFARELEKTFFADLEKSTEIRLQEWKKRGLFKRFLERTCRLFAEQY